MSTFDNLDSIIQSGMNGDNRFIPIGLPKLGRYANLRERILTLLFSTTGAGKSAMIDTIILNACRLHMEQPSTYKIKPDFQLFSMERAKVLRVAKWISYFIFVNEGEAIEIPKMLGWWDQKLSKVEYDLVKSYKSQLDQILNDYVEIHEGAKSPNEIYKIMKDHFEERGKHEEVEIKGKKHKIYNKHNPDEICVPIFDHGNLTRTTKDLPTKKLSIDKLVEYVQGLN